MLTGAVMPRMGRCRTASICRSYNITSESDLIAASEKIEVSRQVSTPADKTSTKTDTSAFGADFAPNENAPKWQKNGGDDETRTRDLGRDSLAWIGFTTYENAGTANAKQVAQNHANCGLGCGLEVFKATTTTASRLALFYFQLFRTGEGRTCYQFTAPAKKSGSTTVSLYFSCIWLKSACLSACVAAWSK